MRKDLVRARNENRYIVTVKGESKGCFEAFPTTVDDPEHSKHNLDFFFLLNIHFNHNQISTKHGLKFTQDVGSIIYKNPKKTQSSGKERQNKAKDYTVAGTTIFDFFFFFPEMERGKCYKQQ